MVGGDEYKIASFRRQHRPFHLIINAHFNSITLPSTQLPPTLTKQLTHTTIMQSATVAHLLRTSIDDRLSSYVCLFPSSAIQTLKLTRSPVPVSCGLDCFRLGRHVPGQNLPQIILGLVQASLVRRSVRSRAFCAA